MNEITFYSYKPFLQVAPCRGMFFLFDKECKCVETDEGRIKILREYAESTRSSYIVVEAGSGIDQQDLQRLHDEAESKLIHEAEEREQKRIKEELVRREKHELFSLLRM